MTTRRAGNSTATSSRPGRRGSSSVDRLTTEPRRPRYDRCNAARRHAVEATRLSWRNRYELEDSRGRCHPGARHARGVPALVDRRSWPTRHTARPRSPQRPRLSDADAGAGRARRRARPSAQRQRRRHPDRSGRSGRALLRRFGGRGRDRSGRHGRATRSITVHAAGQFTGEVNMISGRRALFRARVRDRRARARARRANRCRR